MKIRKGRVDWRAGLGNRPSLYLLVDEIPPFDALRFVRRPYSYDSTDEFAGLYFAEHEGYCCFFAYHNRGRITAVDFDGTHVPHRGNGDGGFGGTKFQLHMRDGDLRQLHGPWSSSSSTMNENGFGPCTEAFLSTDPETFVDTEFKNFDRTPWIASAVLVSLLREYADRIDVGPGFSWRPESRYAAEVAFPAGSRFALACTGYAVQYTRHSRESRFVVVPEVFPDGANVASIRQAILAACEADNVGEQRPVKSTVGHELAHEIAGRYQRFMPAVDPFDALLALSSYEAAVQLPDGEYWTKPTIE